jgi:hypothetical protein
MRKPKKQQKPLNDLSRKARNRGRGPPAVQRAMGN